MARSLMAGWPLVWLAAAACSSSGSGGGNDGGSSGSSSGGGASDSSSGGEAATPLTPDTFVAQLPAARCAVYFRCCKTTEIPNIPILASNTITTQAQCEASTAFATDLGFQCMPAEVNQYHAMTFDPQKAQACLDDLASAPCSAGLEAELWGSPNCQQVFAGSLPLGSQACSSSHCSALLASAFKPNSECTSGDCNSQGVCATPMTAGGACRSDSDCGPGLWCFNQTSCRAAIPAGGTCTAGDQCASPQICFTSPAGGSACELVCTGP